MASTFSITDIAQVGVGVFNVSLNVKTDKAAYDGIVCQWQLASTDVDALNAKVLGIVAYYEAQEAATVPALPAAFAALVPVSVEPTIGA
jgi:hypothetical protein